MLKMSRFVNPKVSKVLAVRLLLASYDNAILEDFLQTFPVPWQSICNICPFHMTQPLQFEPSCPTLQNITYWLLSLVEDSTSINLSVVDAIVCSLSLQETHNTSKVKNNKICCCDNLSFFILCDNLIMAKVFFFRSCFIRYCVNSMKKWQKNDVWTRWHNKCLFCDTINTPDSKINRYVFLNKQPILKDT